MKGKVLYASRENCRGVIFEIAIHVTQKVFPRHSFYAAIANNISFLFWQQKPLMCIRAGRLFQTGSRGLSFVSLLKYSFWYKIEKHARFSVRNSISQSLEY